MKWKMSPEVALNMDIFCFAGCAIVFIVFMDGQTADTFWFVGLRISSLFLCRWCCPVHRKQWQIESWLFLVVSMCLKRKRNKRKWKKISLLYLSSLFGWQTHLRWFLQISVTFLSSQDGCIFLTISLWDVWPRTKTIQRLPFPLWQPESIQFNIFT